MKETLKRAGIALAVGLIIIQFIHPQHNQSAGDLNNDISKVVAVPTNVATILKTSCYDCHSNNTVYPWYSNIQPVDWWLNNHVADGKRHLNFSEFATYKKLRQVKKLKETAEEVEEEGMPLPNYLWIHKNAILTPEQKNALITWANAVSDEIYATVTPEEKAEEAKRLAKRKKE